MSGNSQDKAWGLVSEERLWALLDLCADYYWHEEQLTSAPICVTARVPWQAPVCLATCPAKRCGTAAFW